MKKINLTIFAPDEKLVNGVDFNINIKDDATLIDVLSSLDKEHIENPEKSIFPLYKGLIHGYLQLIWDAEENKIYEDCGIDAYGPNRKFMPLRNNADFILYPNSNITIIVHAD